MTAPFLLLTKEQIERIAEVIERNKYSLTAHLWRTDLRALLSAYQAQQQEIFNLQAELEVVRLRHTAQKESAMDCAKHVADLRAQVAALTATQKDKWQPIESAPKDMTLIMCAHPEFGIELRYGVAARDENGGEYNGPALGCGPHWCFTHWMPPPSPPPPENK